MEVRILIDEKLKSKEHVINRKLGILQSVLNTLNIKPSFFYYRLRHAKAVNNSNPKEKTLYISNQKLGTIYGGILSVGIVGKVNNIGGNKGVINLSNDMVIDQLPLICLHEIMHLAGLKHCKSRGCVMGFVLCDREFKYCATCAEKCKTPFVCDKCQEGLDECRNS